MIRDLTDRERQSLRRLREALHELDDETRQPGEEALLSAVARQVRDARAEVGRRGGGHATAEQVRASVEERGRSCLSEGDDRG